MTDGTIIMAAEPKSAELLSICDMTQKTRNMFGTGESIEKVTHRTCSRLSDAFSEESILTENMN